MAIEDSTDQSFGKVITNISFQNASIMLVAHKVKEVHEKSTDDFHDAVYCFLNHYIPN